jgi:hypothetical protein
MVNMKFLAAMLAEMKEEIIANIDANQERLKAKLDADREEGKADRKAMHGKLLAKLDADLTEAKWTPLKSKWRQGCNPR